MKALTAVPVSDKTRRSGMTLVEVVLGIAILAIMAVLGAGALFYPRYLVVTSALEQNAIHAGSYEIERRLSITNGPAGGQFNLTGWNTAATTNTVVSTPNVAAGDGCDYYKITTTITYPDRTSVTLETYRSREVTSSFR